MGMKYLRMRVLCAEVAMRRTILLTLAALMLATTAMAEMALDSMDLEALYTLRDAVEARIEAMEHANGAKKYTSGRYAVGTEIPAGDYTLVENESAVFANVVIREGPEDEAALVSHHLIDGRGSIRLSAGTWVTLYECTAYTLTQAPEVNTDKIGEGGYLVGTQIPEGRYTAAPRDKAPLSTYSVYSGIMDTGAQLTKFEVLHDECEITLNAGEYIELSGCLLCYIDESN